MKKLREALLLIIHHRRPGLRNQAYGIPSSEWPTVLRLVLEKKEPLRQVADEYHVSHETIRRTICAATKEHVQRASQLSHLS
jgi:hypothetical protein